MRQFSDKTDNFDFLGPNLPKNEFWGQNFKNLDLESASLRYYVHQFLNKTDNFEFLGPDLPKNGFWVRNSKNLSLDSELTPPIYHVCQLLIFRPKFGEIAQLRAIFWFKYCWGCCRELGGGWNELGGGGWSWVEIDMSWVEVDGAGWSWVHSLVIPDIYCVVPKSTTVGFPYIFQLSTFIVQPMVFMVHAFWYEELTR